MVVCNLKPRKMRGISSNGMLLCASNEEHTQVEPLSPPEAAQPGQRIHFGEHGTSQPEPMSPNQVHVFRHLKHSMHGVAVNKGMQSTGQPSTLSPKPLQASARHSKLFRACSQARSVLAASHDVRS